jgi:methyltransferase (TIGR00027 family)
MAVAFWRSLGDRGATSVPGFSDPFARKLLNGPVAQFMLRRADRALRGQHSELRAKLAVRLDVVLLRVAFIDAVIADARPRQVVIVGAGLDTRAWRLPALRGVPVFEVDHPATQAYKRERTPLLGPALADVHFVPVDFTVDDLSRALRDAGHDPNVPTVWVWEGVIMYLDDAALRSTLAAIRASSAPDSTLIAHYHEPEATQASRSLRNALFQLLGEPQSGVRSRSAMRDELERAGFQVREDAGPPDQAARVGAPTNTHPRIAISRIIVAS